MPVEIRELVIRTNIMSDNTQQKAALTENEREELKKEIISECTKQVLDHMKKKMNR